MVFDEGDGVVWLNKQYPKAPAVNVRLGMAIQHPLAATATQTALAVRELAHMLYSTRTALRWTLSGVIAIALATIVKFLLR